MQKPSKFTRFTYKKVSESPEKVLFDASNVKSNENLMLEVFELSPFINILRYRNNNRLTRNIKFKYDIKREFNK